MWFPVLELASESVRGCFPSWFHGHWELADSWLLVTLTSMHPSWAGLRNFNSKQRLEGSTRNCLNVLHEDLLFFLFIKTKQNKTLEHSQNICRTHVNATQRQMETDKIHAAMRSDRSETLLVGCCVILYIHTQLWSFGVRSSGSWAEGYNKMQGIYLFI